MASKAILDFIGHKNCMVPVATHDNELTKNSLYKQYHFKSRVVDNDIHFDYKIKDGISKIMILFWGGWIAIVFNNVVCFLRHRKNAIK